MAAFLVDYENVFAHVGLNGAEFLNESDRVINVSEHESAPRKELYTGSLHSFGRADGMAIYRILKDVV